MAAICPMDLLRFARGNVRSEQNWLSGVILCALTIVGGVREAWSVWRRGRLGTVCARVACPAWSSGPSTSPLDSMRKRRRSASILGLVLAVMAIALTACESMGGEMAGSFYSVQLKEPIPSSACIELARQIAAVLPLRVEDETYPSHPKGQCLVDLRSVNLANELGVTILSSPTDRRILLQFRELRRGHMDAFTPTGMGAELTSQTVALTQKRFPDVSITATHPHYGLLGP